MAGKTEERAVPAGGGRIIYTLERKNVKNINLRVRRDGSVYVSANRRVPAERIDAFVRERSEFVLRAQARFEELAENTPEARQYASGESFYILGRPLELSVTQGSRNAVRADAERIYLTARDADDRNLKRWLMEKFYAELCLKHCAELLKKLYPAVGRYGARFPALRVRSMKSRWGSCMTQKGIITINTRLMQAPEDCVEYVVMHELCHLVVPNHSAAFHGLMTELMPDWRARKTRLNDFAERHIM